MRKGEYLARGVHLIKINEKWDHLKAAFEGDIAVLELTFEVTINNYVRPVCLPEVSISNNSNAKRTLVGWGFYDNSNQISDIPRKIELNIIPDGPCFRVDGRLLPVSSDDMFCAGKKGVSVCSGDSGSGFYVEQDGKFYLKGIVSVAGADECGDGFLALYSDVEKYMDFISQQIDQQRRLYFDEKVSNQMERAAFNFFNWFRSESHIYESNFAISPFLIHHMLMMVAEGSSGTSLNELKKVLFLEDIIKSRDFHYYLKNYLRYVVMMLYV